VTRLAGVSAACLAGAADWLAGAAVASLADAAVACLAGAAGPGRRAELLLT
jgi:hypothetical protein